MGTVSDFVLPNIKCGINHDDARRCRRWTKIDQASGKHSLVEESKRERIINRKLRADESIFYTHRENSVFIKWKRVKVVEKFFCKKQSLSNHKKKAERHTRGRGGIFSLFSLKLSSHHPKTKPHSVGLRQSAFLSLMDWKVVRPGLEPPVQKWYLVGWFIIELVKRR